jgi:hypothetical protein
MEKLSGTLSSFAISVATFFPDNELTIWNADPEGIGHQPHVFHRATEAEDAQEIAF